MRIFKGRKYNQVWCLWHGGCSYGLPEMKDAESFPGIREAKREFELRYFNIPHEGCLLTPCVDDTATMRVYLENPADSRNPYPEFEIVVKRNKKDDVSFKIQEC